jgi:peptidoglycan hydrolase-like protein with peptidoglycan-binding domain
MARFNQTTVTVVNRTTSTLVRLNEGVFEGGFRTGLRKEIAPGTQDTFSTIEARADEGDEGFVIYDIGGNQRTFWTVQWSNPELPPSTAQSSLSGDDAEFFDVDESIPEEGGDVAVSFEISDAPRLTSDDFIASKPAEDDEPTLRFGDQTADGWVEYLQRLLTVEQTGTFDDATLIAVRAFQLRKNREPNTPSTGQVLVDGVVGHQTWALLREEDARPPSTDGLPPHSFVEEGREARWLTEDSAFVFLDAEDRLIIQGVSTGDTPIESGAFNARFMIVLPNGDAVVRDRPIFTADGRPTEPGQLLFAEFEGAADRARNNPSPDGAGSTFSFQAFMPAELGGDTTESLAVPFT